MLWILRPLEEVLNDQNTSYVQFHKLQFELWGNAITSLTLREVLPSSCQHFPEWKFWSIFAFRNNWIRRLPIYSLQIIKNDETSRINYIIMIRDSGVLVSKWKSSNFRFIDQCSPTQNEIRFTSKKWSIFFDMFEMTK